jgi:hypothetical protein
LAQGGGGAKREKTFQKGEKESYFLLFDSKPYAGLKLSRKPLTRKLEVPRKPQAHGLACLTEGERRGRPHPFQSEAASLSSLPCLLDGGV